MLQVTRQRLVYVAADFLAANAAWFAFNIIRFYTLPYNYPTMSWQTYFSMPMIVLGQILFPVMVVLLYAVSGYYNKVFFKSRLDDLLNAAGVSIISVAVIFLTTLFNDSIDDRMGNIEMIAILWLLFTLLTSIPRLLITKYVARQIWRRKIGFNALIIGKSPTAMRLADDLENKHRTMGLRIKGFVTGAYSDHPTTPPSDHPATRPSDHPTSRPSDHPVSRPSDGSLPRYPYQDIQKAIVDNDIDALILASDSGDISRTVQLVNELLPTGKTIYLTPALYHMVTSRPRTSMVAGQVLIDVSQPSLRESTRNLKRLGDIAGSSIALVLLAPVFAVIAMLIKLDSKGPVLYRQERIGYRKKPFDIIKFRTMRVGAEPDGPALSSPDDPRVTRVGRTLRKYRLDELPQFWNVLKGEMSIVGPRPERAYYLKQIIDRAPYYALLHQVRPGITSWGMVKYGYASDVSQMIERMQYDLIYIENVSLVVDLKILFYTVNTVVTGKGI